MYQSTQMNQYIQQLYSHISFQADKLTKLEQSIKDLQSDMAALKEKPPIHIDRIEYKFDQLKVERLDGTLTIGVTPNGMKSIEDMAVNGKSMGDLTAQTGQNQDQNQQIRQDIRRFLRQEVPKDIQQLEATYNLNLTEEFRQLMIEDLDKQMEQRIRHYVNQVDPQAQQESREISYQHIIAAIKRDINTALVSYFQNLNVKDRG